MSANNEIKIKLEGMIKQSEEQLKGLREAGAFKGTKGNKDYSAAKGTIEALRQIDFSKLDGKTLKLFRDGINNLRNELDKAAKSLTNLSKEYQIASKKQEEQQKKVNQLQNQYSDALDKQKAALDKINLGENTFKNRVTGRKVSSAKTIAELEQQGNLDVFNKNGTKLSGAARNSTLQSTGISEYIAASQSANRFGEQLDAANKELLKFTEELGQLNKTDEAHPLTQDVLATTMQQKQGINEIINAENAKKKQDIDATADSLGEVNAQLDKQPSAIGKAFKAFTVYALILRTVRRAAREAISTIKELDKSLTEQAMVTGLTRKQTYGLLSDYQQMASRLGTTTKEVASTMTEFLRQGRSITEATKLTEAAVSAARVAGISAADSINYLTTAINGFRLSASDAMAVSDKFAAVAATAATSYEEIAIALSKVAAQANLAGMSIDYTTALLTKGIETTREAPETIGTALKTVIARMRELGDYGKTLEGDMDLNNVESQLAYIGIRLRDNQGELRSTEDVLNDLGAQWDQLDSNQQAAIAKALAGTRQQSRLIAMMQDYERVTELQQIAAESSGATMAQMATYMQGMEASLNKVNVAWETLISNITNSDVIIGLINTAASVLETIANNLWLLIPAGVALLGYASKSLNMKIREAELSRLQVQFSREEQINQNKLNKALAQGLVIDKQDAVAQKKILVDKQKSLVATLKAKNASAARIKKEEVLLTQYETEAKQAELELKAAERRAEYYEKEGQYLEAQNSAVSDLRTQWSGLGSTVGSFFASALPGLIQLITQTQAAIVAQKAHTAAVKEGQQAEQQEGQVAAAGSAAKIPYVGWIIWAVIMGGSVISAVATAIKSFNSLIGSSADKINDLSKDIYDLNKRGTELDSAISSFDKLDQKIIKTKDDIEEMNSILESAADSLSTEQKEVYDTLTTRTERIKLLRTFSEQTQNELAGKRSQQRSMFQNLSGKDRNLLLTSSDAKWAQARDAIYALNNATLYQENFAEATQEVVQNLMEQLKVEKALALTSNDIKDLAEATEDYAEILTNEDSALAERVQAYKDIEKALQGDADALDAFREAYQEWGDFYDNFGKNLDFLTEKGVKAENLNNIQAALIKTGLTAEEATAKLVAMFDLLGQGENIGSIISSLFNLEDYTTILNAYEKEFGLTLLNAGQQMDKLQNQVSSIYEKATKWSSMKQSEKTEFISENADLFKGESGQTLLNAFNSGNYEEIRKALAANEGLLDQQDRLLTDLKQQLEIEKQREDVNAATIQILEEQIKILESSDFYLADLQTRLEQEQAQLDIYKDYLQKQQDALSDSLEKRKDAYQKYFDAINQEAEDQDYEKNVDLLLTNLGKLAASTDAASGRTRAELEQKLQELEEERVKELRERAQEAVIQNIDDQISHMSDTLDKLLDNNQLLLQAMLGDLETGGASTVANILSNNLAGMTANEAQDYLTNTFSAFGPRVSSDLMDNLHIEERNGDVYLTIPGQGEVNLTQEDNQKVYNVIMNLMKEVGVR